MSHGYRGGNGDDDDRERSFSRDTVAIYSGDGDDSAPKWFALDVATERFSEGLFGELGVDMWRGEHPKD